MTNAISNAVQTDIRRDRIRQLAARTSPKNSARPPWAWTNLTPDEAVWIDDALDEFVEIYNRIHVATVDEVIPACWRLHPAAAQELPVQFWAWWNAHLDPTATIAVAVDYYQRVLPGFQTRLTTRLLGKSAVNCRKADTHPPSTAISPAPSASTPPAPQSRRGAAPRPGGYSTRWASAPPKVADGLRYLMSQG